MYTHTHTHTCTHTHTGPLFGQVPEAHLVEALPPVWQQCNDVRVVQPDRRKSDMFGTTMHQDLGIQTQHNKQASHTDTGVQYELSMRSFIKCPVTRHRVQPTLWYPYHNTSSRWQADYCYASLLKTVLGIACSSSVPVNTPKVLLLKLVTGLIVKNFGRPL